VGSSREATKIYFRWFFNWWSYNKTLWTPEEVEIITDNFVKPGNVEGGFSWYRANLSPGLDHSGPVLEKRQQRKETRLTRPRPPILPTAAEAIAQLRRSIEQLRAERDATTLAINLKLRELTVARWEMAVHLRSRGYSLRQLAKLFGVSPERIRQITLKPAPMSPQPKSMRTAKTKTCVDCGVVISPTSERPG
jgi:hypothetical protein